MYNEYKKLDLPAIDQEILAFWAAEKIFERSVSEREGAETFVFYEGPPSANGMPGIHHVLSRAIKDTFCRFQTLQGKQVHRKGGWDTHGLPIELAVEKELGITKEDIGKTISIADYNAKCKETVMRFKDRWDDLTVKMGYWVDLDNPYITFEAEYMESVWYLLGILYDKGLMYKGYTIQPYSPAAGTGLSSHEVNQPGAYQDVTDTTACVLFSVIKNNTSAFLFENENEQINIAAWTTTPWTLPSNTGLTVGPNIDYVKVKTENPHTKQPISVVVAEKLVSKWFDGKNQPPVFAQSQPFKGSDLEGIVYEQLLPYGNKIEELDGKTAAFKVILGTFVTTADGTGVVHTAPSFGADDRMAGKAAGLGTLTLVDKRGRFVDTVGEFSDEFVKAEYLSDAQKASETERLKNLVGEDELSVLIRSIVQRTNEYLDVNERIVLKLQLEGKLLKKEKYVHSYPHCWRTDKPILYYPLDSWFIKASSMRERMLELNSTINWKPAATGEGRFGKWLENLQDWNLSRSRYWGIPLPIWRTAPPQPSAEGRETDGDNAPSEILINSLEKLRFEIEKANRVLGLNQTVPTDLHRPYIDDVILVDDNGSRMVRELDLIDVWFDSGSMPYAQHHYPFSPTPALPKGGEGREDVLEDVRTNNNVESVVNQVERLEKAKEYYEIFKMSNPFIYEKLKEYSKRMRQNPTDAEVIAWDTLRGQKLGEHKFRRQHPIDNFIVDFICLKEKLIVELDGSVHDSPEAKEYDKLRTEILEAHGYTVVRFTNNEVLHHASQFLASIKQAIEDKKHNLTSTEHSATHTSASPPTPLGRAGVAQFPADFIAEGVDQTRGWFYTLHAIATMCFDSVAYKNVVSNGLVLDKLGRKMSKRWGNATDPFETIAQHGADVTRWYMMTNSQPWDNLKFDPDGLTETRNKFFGTLYNTYNFFAIYANADGFVINKNDFSKIEDRSELDRWVLSKLNSLLQDVTQQYSEYEPTQAGRVIEEFVDAHLSNWYVRLGRKRFWRSEGDLDKKHAYETLYECLETIAQLMSPIAPFFGEWLYKNLTSEPSVHLSILKKVDERLIDKNLEQRMDYAQRISSLVLSLRKAEKIRVRQPLSRILLPVLDNDFQMQVEAVQHLILQEVNIKTIQFISDTSGVVSKKVKPNFKALGKKLGKNMAFAKNTLENLSQGEIADFETQKVFILKIENDAVEVLLEEVEIVSDQIPGWSVQNDGAITVALDTHISDDLRAEGTARELVNRIQMLRKSRDFNVTDRIHITLQPHESIAAPIAQFADYIKQETLADTLTITETAENGEQIELLDGVLLLLGIALA